MSSRRPLTPDEAKDIINGAWSSQFLEHAAGPESEHDPLTRELAAQVIALRQANTAAAATIEGNGRARVELMKQLEAATRAINRARAAIEQVERHCPCGARPESPKTHPHVGGCPVAAALVYLAVTAGEGEAVASPPPLEQAKPYLDRARKRAYCNHAITFDALGYWKCENCGAEGLNENVYEKTRREYEAAIRAEQQEEIEDRFALLIADIKEAKTVLRRVLSGAGR